MRYSRFRGKQWEKRSSMEITGWWVKYVWAVVMLGATALFCFIATQMGLPWWSALPVMAWFAISHYRHRDEM